MRSPDAMAGRWQGQPGRVEVWYATLSDPETELGCWVHYEMVSPVAAGPYAHGWAALFRPGTAPVIDRFGPATVGPDHGNRPPLTVAGATFRPPSLRGETTRLGWDLRWSEDPEPAAPLFTFPRWAWQREALPAAQVVAVPSAPFAGTIRVDNDVCHLSNQARGSLAHIYGHANAKRWGWLHAELGGGDVLEIVSAVSRRPGLDRLPPLAFVQLRLGGHDWPRDPLAAAPLFRTELGRPTWSVAGTVGRWRLRAEVTMPDARCVDVAYVDPDGATATCTNSEIADAEIVLERRRRTWEVALRWDLRGCAHAEIGSRP